VGPQRKIRVCPAALPWQSKFPVHEGLKSTQHHAFEVPHGAEIDVGEWLAAVITRDKAGGLLSALPRN
jgi:hypothetical protein